MAMSASPRLSLTAAPMEPPAEAWQKLKRPSKTGQSSPTLKRLSWREKVVSERVSGETEERKWT